MQILVLLCKQLSKTLRLTYVTYVLGSKDILVPLKRLHYVSLLFDAFCSFIRNTKREKGVVF